MRSSATRHGANLRPLEKKNRKNISARRLCLLLSLLYFFSLCLRRERSIVGRITGYTVSDEHPTVLRRLCPLSTTGGHICTPIGARSSFRYARRSCVGGHVTEKRGKNVTLGRAPLDWPSPRSGTRSKYRRIEARRLVFNSRTIFSNSRRVDCYCQFYIFRPAIRDRWKYTTL